MFAAIEREVVLELPLLLKRLLRHVAAGADAQIRKRQIDGVVISRNEVVPILIAGGERVHDVRCEDRSQSRIGYDELVRGEIVSRQIARRTVLVIQSAIVLVGIT